MLGLRVPVRMTGVGRSHRDADGKEGEQRGGKIGAGVQRLGEEAEAVRGETGRKLDDHEHGRGHDGDERRSPLWAHAGRLCSGP